MDQPVDRPIQRKSDKRVSEMIVDADIHVNDPPEALAPYCRQPWRQTLELMSSTPHRYLNIPGYCPSMKLDPWHPGEPPRRSCRNAEEMRDGLDMLDIDCGILLPDNLLFFAVIPNKDYSVALCQAYNRWLEAEWVREDKGLYGAIMVCPQDIKAAVVEIETYAGKPGWKSIYLPTAGINPLWGDRKYDPIFEAAQAADLPVLLHSVTCVSPSFPGQIDQFENQFARQVIGHSFNMQANLISLMHTGVPARYPKLKIVFTEAGISWVPHLLWRMDRYQQEMRKHVPFLEELPSFYIKRQMWFATQPLEEPQVPKHFVETMMHYDGEDRTVFASDWPHHDFDHPDALFRRIPLTEEQRAKIMWKNAVELFNIPVREGVGAGSKSSAA